MKKIIQSCICVIAVELNVILECIEREATVGTLYVITKTHLQHIREICKRNFLYNHLCASPVAERHLLQGAVFQPLQTQTNRLPFVCTAHTEPPHLFL